MLTQLHFPFASLERLELQSNLIKTLATQLKTSLDFHKREQSDVSAIAATEDFLGIVPIVVNMGQQSDALLSKAVDKFSLIGAFAEAVNVV